METALALAKQLRWGTYGPGAMEAYEVDGTPLPEVVYKTLAECDTDHLEKIIASCKLASRHDGYDLFSIAVRLVLEDRLKHRSFWQWFVGD
jgi:hypothetical protein